jgi:hypothetical protein
VVLKNKGIINHEDLYTYLKQKIAYFMVPRYYEFKDVLSDEPTIKIKIFTLKNEWEEEEIRRKTWDANIKDFISK